MKLDSKALVWSQDAAAPLLEQFVFDDPDANAMVVGTGHFRSGQRMPAQGTSTYQMREITVILEGSIETTVGRTTVVLNAGDIVTIPANSRQSSHFLEDTKLIYLFFGRKAGSQER